MTPSQKITGFLLCLGLLGCAGRGSIDILESRLRQQNLEIQQLQSDLSTTKSDLTVTEQDARRLREQLTQQGQQPLNPEQSRLLYSIQKVAIDPLLTSMITNLDGGQRTLNLVVTPYDEQGAAIRLPGHLKVVLLDRSDSELKTWSVNAKTLRDQWTSGFVSAGFATQSSLSAKIAEQVDTVQISFETVDGRVFEDQFQLLNQNASEQRDRSEIIQPVMQTKAETSSIETETAPAGFPDFSECRIDTSDIYRVNDIPIKR